ncbi:hypothetical protein FXO38_34598 [Capsicum annuum]|uniref:KIB1-4 beta-propeller domain-containing protein n=1 Tax=Capsicum annuum TaxID=4072 RepID=A0A2G3ADM2_CAPAN|nr:probable F-box protein At1g65740 [Capsicum annuum]KAF3616349.1 hypothetical protein FXO38_34598 [Capsicum annuum]PHT92349.1 hypothetical protein T459_00231 [Capsicum annuum]
MTLLHPFSRTNIPLPSINGLLTSRSEYTIKEIREHYIDQGILSANPSDTSDYALVVVRHHFAMMSFWRPGDLNWTKINFKNDNLYNVVYFKGQFYVLTFDLEVWVFDIAEPIVKPRLLVHQLSRSNNSRKFYLVEVSGALVIVTQSDYWKASDDGHGYYYSIRTIEFNIYEVDEITGKLNEINTLGDSSIFLGRNGTTCIDSSRFTAGIKPTYIYFTNVYGPYGYMGAYNIKNGCIESLCPELELELSLGSNRLSTSWVTPSDNRRIKS